MKIKLGNFEKDIQAMRLGNQLWLHLNGKNICIELNEKKKSKKFISGQSTIDPEVLAPMPGKITKLQVIEGATVKKGQILIVMEAMKMEYTLKAESDSSIEKIFVKPGDQVKLGDLLIKVNLEAGK